MPPRPNARPSPTHFLCIPLVTSASRPQLSKSLASFKADVTNPDSFAVQPDAVRPLGTLHLTLGIMSLAKDEGISKATEVLKSLKPRDILAGITPLSSSTPLAGKAQSTSAPETDSPLRITLRGLHCMKSGPRADPSKASVLYAPPEQGEGVFQTFCEKIRATFEEAGVIGKDDRGLLLHATIVNTIYVKGGWSKKGPKLTIDARDILDRYDDYIWMEDVPLEKITICRMGAKKIEGTDDEAYEVEAEIDI
ncbi:kinase A anchor protein [Colletotrichum godetiae]|uniref:Kinase A anchor protein n=1 Tax=Colletotrichum godetiae TaxID=1209918 RepID=A0AAJ0AIA9_9PEZI|nr:kinase A anchor protein [Colletotrichum godetiae]KAK1674411.1 kinase A anchor protein [Colletotrichum godetiae]